MRWEVIRVTVPPLLFTYLLFVAMFVAVWRRPPGRYRFRPPTPPREFVRYLAVTGAAGYGIFLLLVLLFHVIPFGDAAALPDAAGSGAALLGFSLPVFAALSAAEAAIRRRRERRDRGGG